MILEIDPLFQRDPSDLSRVYVAGSGNSQVPLSSVARVEKALSPLVINHQGQFPAVTITYNLAPNVPLAVASAAIDKAVELGVTDPKRVGVGGHSYGAFMTANLLAHSDLVAAGIARSGAYNRTLTPLWLV